MCSTYIFTYGALTTYLYEATTKKFNTGFYWAQELKNIKKKNSNF